MPYSQRWWAASSLFPTVVGSLILIPNAHRVWNCSPGGHEQDEGGVVAVLHEAQCRRCDAWECYHVAVRALSLDARLWHPK